MSESESFAEYVREQVQGLRGVEFRRMFGGYGLYSGAKFFGILYKGRLYFKTDAQSSQVYRERGMEAFKPSARQTLKNYFEVPVEVLEDSELLVAWARRAIDVPGERVTTAKRSRKKK